MVFRGTLNGFEQVTKRGCAYGSSDARSPLQWFCDTFLRSGILAVTVVLMCTTPAKELQADSVGMDFGQGFPGNGGSFGCLALPGNNPQFALWFVRRRLTSRRPPTLLDLATLHGSLFCGTHPATPATVGPMSPQDILPPLSKRFYLSSGGLPPVNTLPGGPDAPDDSPLTGDSGDPPFGGGSGDPPPPLGSAVVPLPASVWSGIVLATILGLCGVLRRTIPGICSAG
jgi:hypothetical protein